MTVNSFITNLVLALSIGLAGQLMARPVIVFSGGFGSCAMMGSTSEIKSSQEMDQLVERLRVEAGQRPVEVRACYALGSESTIYVTSEELDIVDVGMSRDEFHQVVRSAANLAGSDAPVYLWGQSHGGWTVMNIVANVSGLNYRVLTTVDPISVAECGPVVFSGGVLTGEAEGCQRAPKDLEDLYPTIADRVAHWVNWYQVEFTLLHSSEILQADQNIQRNFDAPWWTPMGSHSMTERDPIMWAKTVDVTSRDVRKASAAH